MKLVIGAIAVAFAVPAAAQTSPAQMDHSQHQQSGAQAGHADHRMPKGGSHEGHSMKDGCCADKDGNGKMDCCEKMVAKKGDEPSAKPKDK